jgi:hypothetical protein
MVMNNIVVGGGGAQRQQASKFNPNGYASVNNQGLTASLGAGGGQRAALGMQGAAGARANQRGLDPAAPEN